MNKLGTVGVVGHDAGGAVILASYLFVNGIKFKASVHGPGKEIFERFFENFDNNLEIKNINVDTIITSTSSTTKNELEFIKQAKLDGVRTVSMLDHWVNYKERFIRNGELILPDEIWVTDTDAYEIAISLFEKTKIKQFENPYKFYLKDKYVNFLASKKTNILYCAEPIRKSNTDFQLANGKYFDEFMALETILELFSNKVRKYNFVIKPHPTESIEKYAHILEKFKNLNISISTENDLLMELEKAALVIGCNTMALVVADWLDIAVLNSIPHGYGETVLKIKGMQYAHEVNLDEFLDELF